MSTSQSKPSHQIGMLWFAKDLPNLCSLAGLLCALLGVYFAVIENFPAAVIGMIWAVLFDWGDGITDTLSDSDFPFTHTYTSLGVFYLEITAVGENGCDNDTIYEVANQSNPSINFGNPGGSQG